LAFEAGAGEAFATFVHWLNFALVVAITVYAVLRESGVASYLAVVIASQFMSPVLWDHYGLVLLLPVAWLLDRGWWWAAAIPLATATFLVDVSPPIAYPAAFWAALLAVAWLGARDKRRGATHSTGPSAAA
jgi:hypothetical protein